MDNMTKLLDEKIITIEDKEYSLRLVTESELFKHRISGKPGFVLKINNELWYADIPAKACLRAEKWLKHQCCTEHLCCKRLSALEDPEGCGCIRDLSPASYNSRKFTRKQAYICSMRIEKYSFVKLACETFNTAEEGLKILECSNKIVSILKKREQVESDDDETLEDKLERLKKTVRNH